MTYLMLRKSCCAVVILYYAVCCCSCQNGSPAGNSTADTTGLFLPAIHESGMLVSTLDKSPLDVVYFPMEYPKLKMIGSIKTPPVFRVFYSRPQKSGRQIFGGVVKFGERWRLGANEATEIDFFQDVTIQGTKVPKGNYILYCIPQPTEWTLILNGDLYSWGLKIDEAKDIFKFTVPVIKAVRPIEEFTMETDTTNTGANLWVGWDDTKVALPVDIK